MKARKEKKKWTYEREERGEELPPKKVMTKVIYARMNVALLVGRGQKFE